MHDHIQLSHSTERPGATPSKLPICVRPTWTFSRGPIDSHRDPNILVIRKLGSSGQSHLVGGAARAASDGDVVAVLDQDRIVAVVGEVDGSDDDAAGLRHAEDAAAAAARVHFVNVYVGVVVAVRVLAVVVGHTEGCVLCMSRMWISYGVSRFDEVAKCKEGRLTPVPAPTFSP